MNTTSPMERWTSQAARPNRAMSSSGGTQSSAAVKPPISAPSTSDTKSKKP